MASVSRQQNRQKSESRTQISPFFVAATGEYFLLFIAQPRANPHLDTPTRNKKRAADRKMLLLPRRQLPPNCTSTCQFFLCRKKPNPRPQKRLWKMPFEGKTHSSTNTCVGVCVCALAFFHSTPSHLSWRRPFVCRRTRTPCQSGAAL